MAITTYAELLTAIETFRERAGDTTISGNAADFLTLAEGKLNRKLRNLNRLITTATLTGTTSSRQLTLPSDYREARTLRLTTFGDFQRMKRENTSTLRYRADNGVPNAWAINGSKIDLNCPCDQAHTFQFIYRAEFDLASTTTNWLLDRHPDVYLNAVLVWSGILLMADDVAVYKPLLDEALAEVLAEDSSQAGRATMSVDDALLGSGGYDINTDA